MEEPKAPTKQDLEQAQYEKEQLALRNYEKFKKLPWGSQDMFNLKWGPKRIDAWANFVPPEYKERVGLTSVKK